MFCVAVLLQTVVCEIAAILDALCALLVQVFPGQMCPNNLEAVTSMFASLSVRVLIPPRIYVLKRRVVGVG
jgi:hypothetical protein